MPRIKEKQRYDDRYRRNAPDAIVSLTHLDIAFFLYSSHWSPNTNDHSHFLGDRIKLGKNLKSMLVIRRQSRGADQDIQETSSFMALKHTVSIQLEHMIRTSHTN